MVALASTEKERGKYDGTAGKGREQAMQQEPNSQQPQQSIIEQVS